MTVALIVDDDPDIRDLLELVLGEVGYVAVTAASGHAALEILTRVSPDIVILDVEMPGMSGTELCVQIRSRSSVPIIFLSSRGELDERMLGLKSGADDYVTKPFHPEELLTRIEVVLRRAAPAVLGPPQGGVYCADCSFCLGDDATTCPECEAQRPEEGWPLIAESEYDYLGRVVDDRYVLDKFLGSGAMGWVYRARSRKLHRSFACKIVDGGRFASEDVAVEILQRFELEVEAMSRLRNPHVVSIYESFMFSPGVFALLMDLVEGRTLEELIDRAGRLSIARALDLTRQVANGLHEAHDIGIIHRDLKPANIMVERLPASGFFARVLDFGIARVVDRAAATRGFLGTPLFASPEQCLGDPTDHRSDVYSLGCVLFTCIVGRPPFDGRTSWKVMEAQVHTPPPVLSEVMGSARIPAGLDDLLARLLAKDPAARPNDMAEVIASIDEIVLPTAGEVGAELGDSEPVVHVPTLGPSGLGASDRIGTRLSQHSLGEFGVENIGVVRAVGLAPDGLVCVADDVGRVFALRSDSPGPYSHPVEMRPEVISLATDGHHVFGGDATGRVWRWDLRDGSAIEELAQLSSAVNALATTDDGDGVICGTEAGHVIRVPINGRAPVPLAHGARAVRALNCSRGQVIVARRGGTLTTIGGGEPVDLQSQVAEAKSIALSADGYLAAVLDVDHTVKILNAVSGTSFFKIETRDHTIRALAFSNAGQLVGLGIAGDQLTLWRLGPRMD